MPDQRNRSSRLLGLAVVLALGTLTLGAGPALAQPLQCGDTVTQDTTLTADLLNCPGTGLVIGADGITFDLNGHTISGQLVTGPNPTEVGIDNPGHDGVTIRNGTVTSFALGGVRLAGADRNRVQNLTMSFFRDFAIQLQDGGSANRFTGNHLDRVGQIGISILGAATPSRDNVISGNSSDAVNTAHIALRSGVITGTLIEGNTGTGSSAEQQWGGGIVVDEGGASDIRHTVLRGNRLAGDFGGGIRIGPSASDTVVERNALDSIFGPAVGSAGDRTEIRRNTITSSLFPGATHFGVQVYEGAEDNRVEANTIDRAGFAGVVDGGTRTMTTANLIVGQVPPNELTTGDFGGIQVQESASDGRVQANVVRRQAPAAFEERAGIDILGDRMAVVANLVSETYLSDGIRVEPEAAGTLLQANVTTRNGDDGIDVDSPATTVTANVANDNGDLGIEAVPGVTDGGGNRASGNGNPAQCVGVRCS